MSYELQIGVSGPMKKDVNLLLQRHESVGIIQICMPDLIRSIVSLSPVLGIARFLKEIGKNETRERQEIFCLQLKALF